MFGILAKSLQTAVFGADDRYQADWPRNDRRSHADVAWENEIRRNPYVEFRNWAERGGRS